jgi:hypothetical protein
VQNFSDAEKPLGLKTLQKWICPQGGTFDFDTLTKNINEYYKTRHVLPELMDLTIAVSTQWFLNNAPLPKLHDPLTYGKGNATKIYNFFRGTHRSNGGIVWDTDRRAPGGAAKAVAWAMYAPTCYDKVIAGMRYKDSKYRNIFMDSFSNYFREAMMYHEFFEWWESLPIDTHESNLLVARQIVLCAPKSAYAGDYQGMDFHFNLESALRVVDFYCNIFHATPEQRSMVRMSTEELFYAPLLTADELICGLHNLFSGIYPTHDFECPENFMILLNAALEAGYKVVLNPRKLRKHEVFIKVNGDDSIVLFADNLSEEEFLRFGHLHAKYAHAFGQVLETSKLDYGHDFISFCKNTFALRRNVTGFKKVIVDGVETPVPLYPCAKAVNALYHPESIPHFPQKSDLVIWFCSIMDNSFGTRQWKGTVLAIADMNPDLFGDLPTDISPELRAEMNRDWWFENYADFELPKSPTYQLLKQRLSVK